jgi:hypothetical protein
MKAIDYIRKGWTRGATARDKHGHYVAILSERAVRWCTLGALNAAYPTSLKLGRATQRLCQVIGTCSIPQWNDDPKRTKKEVLEAFRKAGV